MRLFKLIVALVIVGLVVLFVWQNTGTWVSKTNYGLDIYIGKIAFSLELYVVMFLSALGGFLVGFLALLRPYLRLRRTIAREKKEKKAVVEAPPVSEAQREAS